MNEEVMEALDSGTSSESESDSLKSLMKESKSPSLSPRKFQLASPVANENSNSISDVSLSSIIVRKKTKLVIESEDDTESSVSTNIEKQNLKPSNILVSMDENSCSSDVPLSKLVGLTAQYTCSGKKKGNHHEKNNLPGNGSKKCNKAKLKVITDESDTSTIEQAHSSVIGARKMFMSNTKNKKSENRSEKKSLKRKRSGETGSEQGKTKRKLNITSDSSSESDDAVEKKNFKPKSASSKNKGHQISTKKKETIPTTITSSPVNSSKTKPNPASNKNNSSVDQGLTISLTKTEHSTNSKSSSSKPIDVKKAMKLSQTHILEKLDSSSTISSSSEDDEIKTISHVKNKVATQSSSSSESDKGSHTPVKTFKGEKKILLKTKSNETTKSESTSDSDDPVSVNKTVASFAEGEKLSGGSFSSEDSQDVSPNKKKIMQKDKKTSEIETVKEKRLSSVGDSDNPVPSKNKAKASCGEAIDPPGDSSSGSSSSEESENVSPKEKRNMQKDEKKSKKESIKEKKKPGNNPRIVRLQRYLKEAGIRVQNYKTLWQDCKSDKARAEKLMDLLHERGLKGKPSVSECRKLKKKFEREKEVSELNTSNIITPNGRSRRSVTSLFATRRSPSPSSAKELEMSTKKSTEFKKIFGRLKQIVDSEESD